MGNKIYADNIVFGTSTIEGKIGINPQTGTITGLDFTHTETLNCSDTITTGTGTEIQTWKKTCINDGSRNNCEAMRWENCENDCDDFSCDNTTCSITEINTPVVSYKRCVDKSIEVPNVTIDYFSIK